MHIDKKEYKHKGITEKIIFCAFEVQNNLGCGFLEKVYYKALAYEFNQARLKAELQKSIDIIYKGQEVGRYIPDFIIEEKIIVEVKTVEFLSKVHRAQILNYLKATGYEVGLILNFYNPRLEYKRVVI